MGFDVENARFDAIFRRKPFNDLRIIMGGSGESTLK